MSSPSTPPTLVGLLRTTLEQIERSNEVIPGDPAFSELKRSITRAIAELEVERSAKRDSPVEPPPPLP